MPPATFTLTPVLKLSQPPDETAPLVARLRRQAEARGFGLFGVAPATAADGFGRFCDWLDRGFAGEMTYLHKHREHRRHPCSVVEDVKSVVMLGIEYGGGHLPGPHPPSPSPNRRGGVQPARVTGFPLGSFAHARCARGEGQELQPLEHPLSGSERGTGGGLSARVARYARGPDYHRFVWDKLNELSAWLTAEVPGSFTHGTCDSAPLLERDFARRAGLGWFGKNTMLINKRRGSFFFLAALCTTVELPADPPHTASHCGTCTACLDACPTKAFPEPGVLDATKCISYLTIELRGAVPLELREPVGDWLFGCDVCQDVCPWNRHISPPPLRGRVASGASREGGENPFPTNPDLAALDPVELLGLSKDAFDRRFAGTSLLRARRTGLLRNAAIVLGNTGDERALPALEKAMTDADEVVAEAATWAAGRIRARYSAPSGCDWSEPHPEGAEYLADLLLAQHQVHHPAAADVWAVAPAVAQDVGMVAPCLFKRVGEDGHPVERTIGVDAGSEGCDGGGEPEGINRDGAEA